MILVIIIASFFIFNSFYQEINLLKKVKESFKPPQPPILSPTDLSQVKPEQISAEYEKAVQELFPTDGWTVPIKLGDSLLKLVEVGAIDLEKFKKLYESRGGLSEEQLRILTEPSDEEITINFENSNFLLNILWPLGLANKNPVLEESPMNGPLVSRFASSGGWILGKDNDGGVYFNKFEIIRLTPEEQTIAQYVAENTYRPCCGNPTSFPDCNHGAALLGLIELGASEGLTQEQLFDISLKFNSFWFPETYLEIALFYKLKQGIDWPKVNPEEAMGYNFSSGPGWLTYVRPEIDKIRHFLPQEGNGTSCGV